MDGDINNQRHQVLFTELLKRDFSDFTVNETQFFLSFKESQYAARRNKIEQFCDGGKLGMTIRQNTLIYDKKDGISYCQIAKVASSSWCNHFIKLGKFDLSTVSHPS